VPLPVSALQGTIVRADTEFWRLDVEPGIGLPFAPGLEETRPAWSGTKRGRHVT
jgi:hypothetical protein